MFPSSFRTARTLVFGTALLTAAALPPAALAAQYSVTPKIRQDFKYDSNFRLIGNAENVFSYELAPSLNLERETEHLTLGLEAEASFDRFSENEFDSDNQRLDLSAEWKGIKNLFSGSAGLVRDSTLTSEELDSGLGGVIGGASRRELAQVSGGWRRILGPRFSLLLSTRYQDATYEAPAFNDFQYGLVQLALTQVLTERVSVDYTVYGTWFGTEPRFATEAISTSNATTTYAAQVGVTRAFSERLTGSIRLGYRDAELRNDVVAQVLVPPPSQLCQLFFPAFCEFELVETRRSATQGGVIGSIELTYSTELNQLSAKIDVADRPSAQGLLESRDLIFNWRRQLAERLSLAVEGRLSQSEVIRGVSDGALQSFGFFARDYARFSPRIQWRFSQNWALGGGIQYRTQRADNPIRGQGGAVIERSNDSLAVLLSIDYLPGRQLLN